MKKSVIAIVASLALSAPALAGTMTLEFVPTEGETVTVVLNTETSMATMGDTSVPFTFDEAAKTLCADAPEGNVCVTMDEIVNPPTVGASTGYTSTTGETGTMTIKAIDE